MLFLPCGVGRNVKETQTQRIISKLNQGMYNFTFNRSLTRVFHCSNPLSLTVKLCLSRWVRINRDVRDLILLHHYAIFHKWQPTAAGMFSGCSQCHLIGWIFGHRVSHPARDSHLREASGISAASYATTSPFIQPFDSFQSHNFSSRKHTPYKKKEFSP